MRKKGVVLVISILMLLSLTVASFAASQGVLTDKKVVKIGWFGPTSGVFQKIGEGMVDGMKAYLEKLNGAGGVGGYKIEAIFYDNNMDPILTKQVLVKLVKQDRVFAIVGALGSKGINAVVSDMASYGIPVVYLGGGEYFWAVPPKRNIFPVQPDYITEGRLMIQFAVQNLNARRIAFIYRHDDATGETALRGAEIAMKQFGNRVGAKLVLVMKRLAVDVVVAKIKETSPDAVVLFDFFAGASGIVSGAKRVGINTKWITTYVNSDSILYKITGKAWLGVYVAAWAKAVEPVVTEYIKFFKTTSYYRKAVENRWDAPSGYHTAGWIATEIFHGGLKIYMKKYRDMSQLTWDKFIESMENMRGYNDTIAKDITYYPMSEAQPGTAKYYLARRGQLTLYFTEARLTRDNQFYLHPVTQWMR